MQTGDIGEMMNQFKQNGETMKDPQALASDAQETLDKASQSNVQLDSEIIMRLLDIDETSLETQNLLDEANAAMLAEGGDSSGMVVEKKSNSTLMQKAAKKFDKKVIAAHKVKTVDINSNSTKEVEQT